MTTRRAVLCAGGLAALGLAPARAQPYPARPLRLIVPYPPGGVGDTFGRALGEGLSAGLGQPVVIDNKPGGSQIIGAQAAAEAAADGYTLFLGSVSSLAMNVAQHASLPYDPLTSFAPVSLGFTSPLYLVVHPDVPVTSVRELIAYAKANPGKLSFASIGPGSSLHLAGEIFNRMAGLDMLHVPYKGSMPALTDIMAGRVQVIFDAGTSALPQVRAGRLRVLAVTSAERFSGTPDIPTIAESGLPGYDMTLWFGIVTRAGAPDAAIQTLSAAIGAVLDRSDLKARFLDLGVQLSPSSPEAFRALIAREVSRWTRIIRDEVKLEPQ
ncbi:tripartite tricarboxylate transporter substrate binding protein [Reyranella sp. CPCC 100927]|uniref:Bug family tripartite tricarboxylate transporter substrate binding protein n=1 Tax=Reyranella sp. CPCC 100927 TaxID=2599616 RepID=UPI0015B49DB3|nr:tripartite tricarboxylate transporter substrate binding protein [Reyranella sp. CPCC 100927]